MDKRILILFLLAMSFIGCKETGLNLKIRYSQIHNLKEGDRVIFEQNHIGQVADVFYAEDGYYMVDVAIMKNFANAATEHSKFFITSDPLNQGKKAIEITQTSKGGTPLSNGATVIGSARSSAQFNQMLGDFGKALEDLQKQFEEFLDDLRKIPESEEFKKLEKELDDLLEDMKNSGKEAREKIQKEVLPKLKRELEELRERLRKLGREEEIQPLEVQMEKIREM
jgi:paraquat-inducible protein B